MPFTKHTRSRFGFVAGVLGGLAAPICVYTHVDYVDHRSDLNKMRSDWERVGGDFKKVIAHEHGEVPSSSK
ncbi:MAG: hypothetical protein QOI88_3372 [Gammaproteobacteria bacterium]|jgi:hypothetical protein|nr:hypothetical protein [Gammaproteobacteria bacterium]